MTKMFGGRNRMAMLFCTALCGLIAGGPALAEGGGSDSVKEFLQKRHDRAAETFVKKKAKRPPAIIAKSTRAKPEVPIVAALPAEEPIFKKKIEPLARRKPLLEPREPSAAVAVALPKGKSTTKTEIVADQGVRPMVSMQSASWLNSAIARYQEIAAAGGWPKVEGKLKNGSEGSDVERLKRRLHAEGYINDSAVAPENIIVFTEGTEKALSQFQSNYGLPATGFTDKQTLAALNVPVNRRLATLRANVARMDAYTKDLGNRYLLVNIPALQLEVVGNGAVYSRHNVIVGKPERPSPVVMATLKDINFSPYWNVPASIVERDIIPRILKEGISSLDVQNIKVFDGFGGPELTDLESIDWANTPGDRYHLRQEPGKQNAMAAVKISFPSPFGVYMHDTPLKGLFGGAARYLSSGCVRIEKVDVVVNWILNGQDGWNAGRIAQMAASQERLDVELADPPQVRWVYLTAWSDENGFVHFRDDIYDLDGSGFTVGQPLPVGEYAEDGQRFILKLAPAQSKAAASEDFDAVQIFKPRKAKPLAAPEAKLQPKPAAKAAPKTLAKTVAKLEAKPGKLKPSSARTAFAKLIADKNQEFAPAEKSTPAKSRINAAKPPKPVTGKKTKLAAADLKVAKKQPPTEAEILKRKKLLKKLLAEGNGSN